MAGDSSLLSGREVSIIKELKLSESQVKETKRIGQPIQTGHSSFAARSSGKALSFATSCTTLPHRRRPSGQGKEIEAIDSQLIVKK